MSYNRSRGNVSGSIEDVRSLTAQVDRQARAQRGAEEGHVIIDGARELKIRSPNGTYWGIRVDNAGALSTVDLGSTL